MFDRVFYVSYGSNLLESRFQEYMETARWMTRSGVMDKDLLEEYPASYRVNLARDIYYAMGSARWGGGIAFLDIDTFSAKKVYRAYDLNIAQFYAVFSQENGYCDDQIDWDQLLNEGYYDSTAYIYDRIVLLGWMQQDTPVLTFTHSTPSLISINPPGQKYTDVIDRGRKETRSLPFVNINKSAYV